MQHNLGAPWQFGIVHRRHNETTTSRRLPLMAIVVVVLGGHHNLVRHEECRVEADTKLSNHRNIGASLKHSNAININHDPDNIFRILSAYSDKRPSLSHTTEKLESHYLKSLHEGFRSRLGNRSEVIHEVGLCHSNSRVHDSQCFVGFVGSDFDVELFSRIKFRGLSQGLITDLVKSIRRVRDKLTKKDFLVARVGRSQSLVNTNNKPVESVDDQRHQLSNLSLEGKSFAVDGTSVSRDRHLNGQKPTRRVKGKRKRMATPKPNRLDGTRPATN